MSPSTSKVLYVNQSPVKEMNLDLNADDATFKLKSVPIEPLKDGQLLVKSLYFSNDPSQRAWIQKGIPPAAMYVDPIKQGENMKSIAVVQIIESTSKSYAKGEVVVCQTLWSDYAVIPEAAVFNKVDVDAGLPLTAYLDFIGITGLTAYYGLTDVASVKASDVVVVSAAAGATGSMAVQIAKHVIGCKKVIGIAGGPSKCEFVKSIGADECVDYKDPNLFANMVKALGEDKEADVFFDGVGGKILDMMLLLTKRHGQVLACGSIAGYNDSSASNVSAWGLITVRRLIVKGFIVLDFLPKAAEAVPKLLEYFKQGKITSTDDSISLVDLSGKSDAVEQIPLAFNKLFNGEKQVGKLITKLADPVPASKL